MVIVNVSSVSVLWFGGQRVDVGDMQVGALVAFLSYLMQILFSVLMAAMVFAMVPRAEVSAERISQVLRAETSVHRPASPVTKLAAHADLEFREAEFTYPGAEEPVLRGISFHVKARETTAVIGSTGSGKSTLLALVPRLFDVTGGSVLVDGVDVRDLDPQLLWSRIGLVPQQPYLFTGTVGSNLRYGRPDADDEQLWEALRVAQAADFVAALPEGLDAPVAQGGTNFSGGQRQRLAIARALVRRPEIYLFDDSFSALDYVTDARLRAALGRYTGEATVVIVAQRVSSIRHADRIVVLDEGRIAGIGTHDDLMADCETYREIVLSQLTAEEAA
jgi:ATP-binding cassette subfamily B protein